MDSTTSDEAEAKAKARRKEIHRWSMIGTGVWISLTALAAAWIGFRTPPAVPAGPDARPHFDRITRLVATGDPAALRMARAAAAGVVLALEDKRDGGFRRGAAKRLFDQAEAVKALRELEPAAVSRTLAYVERRLTDPKGGYFAGEDASGIDRAKSADSDRLMAEAVLSAGDLAAPAQQTHARRALKGK